MDDDDIIFRVGMFFYVIGGGSFVLFVASDLADKTEFDFLFIAVVLMGIGWAFRRGMAPPPSAGRFAWLNKKLQERRQKQVKLEEKKK